MALGHPIGASSTPVGTRFSVGKSSVLYLCSRLTLERVWLRHLLCRQITVGRHFSAAVGQADFVRTRTKYGFAHRAKSVWPEKGAKVYISPSSHRSIAYVSAFLPFSFAVGHGRFPALADGSFQVFGQLQHLDQVDKLFHCDGIVIDP